MALEARRELPRTDVVSLVLATSLLLWNRGVASRPNRSDLQNHFAILRPCIMRRFRGFRIQRACGIRLEFALVPLFADGKIEGARHDQDGTNYIGMPMGHNFHPR